MIYRLFGFIFSFFISCVGLHAQLSVEDSVELEHTIDSLRLIPVSEQIFEQAQDLLVIFQKNKHEKGINHSLMIMADYYDLISEYEKAFGIYHRIIATFEADTSYQGIRYRLDAYFGLGKTYANVENIEKAAEYFEKSHVLCQVIGDNDKLASLHNAMGIIYAKQEAYDKALEYFEKAKKEYEKIKAYKPINGINVNIALIYIEIGQAKLALPYLENALKQTKTNKDSLFLGEDYGNIAYAYQNIPDFEKAFVHFDSSLYYSNYFRQDNITSITYFNMSDTYRLMGNTEKALEYYEKYHELENTVLNRESHRQINELEVKFQTEKKERELLFAQKQVNELQINRQKMWLLLGALATVFVISILIFIKIRGDLKRERKLESIKSKLVEKELENKKLEAMRLQTELENKKSDITNLALDITRKNEFSEQLIGYLENMFKTPSEAIPAKVREILHFATNHLRINEDLAQFQNNIEEINHEFHQKLETQFENLSNNEKHLCGLIRLNLSNKEIAAIRGISASSAKVNRYRLRKKLSIESDVDIVNFLQKF